MIISSTGGRIFAYSAVTDRIGRVGCNLLKVCYTDFIPKRRASL